MQLKKIKNFTSVPQSVVVDGDQIVIDANTERFFPVEIANEFLAECAESIREVNIAQEYKESTKDDMVYLANMTGNPDAVETVKVKQPTKGVWGMHDTANPLREPRDLSFQMKGPQQEYQGPEGLEGINVFPTTYRIPRYSRRAFMPSVARWIMTRDARCEPHYRNQVIESRPVSWAPDNDWDLDDIRVYLKLCDPRAELGLDQAEVEASCVGMSESEKTIKVYEAKELALRRVHFRISNPAYPLPKQKQFDAFKKKQSGGGDVPVKRGPGRPRKNPEQPAA